MSFSLCLTERKRFSSMNSQGINTAAMNKKSSCKGGSLDSQMALRTVIETGRSLNGHAGEIAAQILLSSNMGDPTLLRVTREAGMTAAQTVEMAADCGQG